MVFVDEEHPISDIVRQQEAAKDRMVSFFIVVTSFGKKEKPRTALFLGSVTYEILTLT